MTRSAVIPEEKNGVLIQINAVTKSFQQHDVLKRLDITLYPGQFTSIIGKSGSGKSTLLKLISGLDVPSEGDILLDGEALNGISGSTTMMFQDSRLLPWKSVIDNVGIGLQGDWRPKALHFLQQVGLENKAEQWPSTLSGGQKQRVALARALVRNPRMLLLDEPLGALDALTRLEMQQLIERLWLEQRFTAILVTHDVNEAITLSDRILLLEDGDIALDMDIDLPRPRSRTDAQVGKWERQILDRIMRNSS